MSQIITFGEYKLKNTTKAIMSYLKCPYEEANEITRDIPDMIDGNAVTYEFIEKVVVDPDKYPTMTEAEVKQVQRIHDKLQDLFQKYPMIYDGIKNVCGCISSTGIHAGGVIVCREPIDHHCGLIDGGDTAVLPLIQWEMTDLDFSGFLKIDALGLKTLDVIKETMDLAGLDYDWYDSEDYTDADVYTMLRNGDTTDIFQFSTYSPTSMLADFNSKCIEDLSAINAGNRPGPLEKDQTTGKSMVDNYIESVKTGVIQSLHPDIDGVLKDTNGCLWYQEQLMSIGRIMAGYSLGASDLRIRKVLGKKKIKQIPEIRNEFIFGKQSKYDEDHNVIGMSDELSPYCEGSLARGYSQELSDKIFDSMAAFAKYCFNKAHSFCYAVIAYKTAWLSYHFPLEFAVANCTVNEDTEMVTATLALAKRRGVKILPPNINHSGIGFTIDNGSIRYGLKAIKGLGTAALTFLNDYRKLDPVPFADFDDYFNRICNNNSPVVSQLLAELRQKSGKQTNNPIKKDVHVALILSGAFDYCNTNRYGLLYHYIHDIRGESEVKVMDNKYVLIGQKEAEKDYTRKVKLALEKHYMGSYISEHPLDPFPYEDIESAVENQVIKTTGIVSQATKKFTKRGGEYLSIKFTTKDDIERTVNVFDENLCNKLQGYLKKNTIIIVTGKVSKRYNNINASNVVLVAFKKQNNAVDTEDMEIGQSDNRPDPRANITTPVAGVPFSSIF